LSTVVKGFEVGSFWAAVLAAALISLVGYLARAR
ncbi:MAG TPA: phage holin family protein, partial [Candidatus Moranbacteria bacterium]|nr:phage holin family protein [Candidatus Moranbacteria bacterium]